MNLSNLNRVAFLILSPVLLLRAVAAQQITESKNSQVIAKSDYPNNSQGLLALLNGILLTARDNDRAKIQSIIRDMEIPKYESWFTATFGQEKGGSWGRAYGKELEKDQKDFEDLLLQLSHMEGRFSIHQIDSANRYDTLEGQLDEYLADWIKSTPRGEEMVHIADFFFIEGRFRWDSAVHYFPFQKPSTHSVVGARLVKKVQPEYPAEAREKGIEGIVKLLVIVGKDGSVTVQNVVEGAPLLSPAAIDAVRQWRYKPTLVDGQPVDVQMTIEVTFALRP